MNQHILDILNQLSPSNQRLAREMIQRLAQLEHLTTPEDHDARLHYPAYITPWLQQLLANAMSPHTLRAYAGPVQRLLTTEPHPKRSHLEATLATAAARGRAPGTIACTIHAYRSFFGYLADRDIITTNPAAKLHRPHLHPIPRQPATHQQVAALLQAPKSPRHHLMILLLADCGIRVNELATLRIPPTHDSPTLYVHGKGDKTRPVPLSPPTLAALAQQLAELQATGYHGPWLFPGQAPSPHVATGSIRGYLHALCRRHSIPPLSPHQLRHYFATYMLTHGASLKTTSAILGHANTSTTANIYWHILDQEEIMTQHHDHSPLASLQAYTSKCLDTNVSRRKKQKHLSLSINKDGG